jgi:hypothetical protein
MFFPVDIQAKGQRLRAKSFFSLPTRLRYPRNLTLKRETAEAQAAEAELAQKSAWPSANAAAIAVLGGKLGFLVRLGDLCCCCHLFPSLGLSAFTSGL